MGRSSLLACLLLASCATTTTDRVYVGRHCRGHELTVRYTEIVSPWPLLECPAEFALLLPLGCTFRRDGRAVMVLPTAATDDVREHELRHLRGFDHPPLLPMAWSCA